MHCNSMPISATLHFFPTDSWNQPLHTTKKDFTKLKKNENKLNIEAYI